MSRPATRIKDLARTALDLIEKHNSRPNGNWTLVRGYLQEIEHIASDIDARTGTSDPSLKGRIRGAIAALRGR